MTLPIDEHAMRGDPNRPKFKCRECGKITRGRLDRKGDGTFYFPSVHRLADGGICIGSYGEGDEVRQ